VLQDGGAVPTGRLIVAGSGYNFNSIDDQPITFPQYVTVFRLVNIIITNASTSLTTAQGGFYPAASKGGTPIVANTQAYSALTTASGLMTATLASFGTGTRFSAATLGNVGGLLAIWFSLTTGQGSVASADIYMVIDNLT
jgi:hypothetical protein